MTHVKNAEVFARIVDSCTGFGGMYNPGRPTLQIKALNDQKAKVHDALNKVIDAKTRFDNEVNHRKQLFNQLPRLVASIMRTLEASGASMEKLEDARAFARMVTGSIPKDSTPALAAGDKAGNAPVIPKSKTRSLSQLSYASRTDSFAKLINAVATESLYLTNEETLGIDKLNEKLNELNAAKAQVSSTRVDWSNSRINRNAVMYQQPESVHKKTQAVKKYVRAVFGPGSEQYAQIKNLYFNKPTK